MTAFKDLTGLSFNNWKVLYKDTDQKRRIHFICRCACGKEVSVSADTLISGTSKQCLECCYKETSGTGHPRFVDVTGMTFGRLQVLEKLEARKNGKIHWKVQCACGNILVVTAFHLVRGFSKSCGCSRYLNRVPYKTLYGRLIRTAKNKSIEVALTLEDFTKIAETSTACHYCNGPLYWNVYAERGKYCGYNIDRKDSSRGYSVENCVACCGECNASKMSRSYEEWAVAAKAIREYREKKCQIHQIQEQLLANIQAR